MTIGVACLAATELPEGSRGTTTREFPQLADDSANVLKRFGLRHGGQECARRQLAMPIQLVQGLHTITHKIMMMNSTAHSPSNTSRKIITTHKAL